MSQFVSNEAQSNVRGSPSTAVPRCLYRACLALALIGAVYFIAAFVYVAVARIHYPFALEWLEGGSYSQVHRLLTGQALYERPDIAYVAMIYPPLYYYVADLLARVLGFSYVPLRLVSLGSALGAFALIYLICRREGVNRAAALLGSGLFAATYVLSGAWFDLARIDMLAVFLLLLSIWLLRFQTLRALILAGIAAGLAALTKQTHLITIACVSLFLLLADWRKALGFVLSFLAFYGATYLLLNHLYGGWYRFYVFSLALGSGQYITLSPASSLETAVGFWANSILLATPVPMLVVLAWFAINVRQGRDLTTLFFYASCAIGMVGTSWAVIQVGGYKNDLIPAYAAISILFGLSVHGLETALASRPMYGAAILAGCTIQFLLMYYPVAAQIPTAGDLGAGRDLVARIQSQAGSVYIPWHPDLAIMAGKEPFASWSPMYQLEGNFGGGDIAQANRVKAEFSKAMSEQEFALIILDQEVNWIWGHPERYYAPSYEPVFSDPNVFWPVTGWETRPTLLMVPNGR